MPTENTTADGSTAEPSTEKLLPQPISGLILDLDDTLIDTTSAMITAGSLVAQDLWPEVGTRIWRAFGERYFVDPRQFYQQYARGELDFLEMRRLRFEESREHHRLAEVGERFATFEGDYWSAFGRAQELFGDALHLLDAADEAGVPMCLVTNSSQILAEMKVRVSGLTLRFVSILTTDTYGIGKPDRRLFDHAATDLAVPVPQIMSVGDHLGRDITPALELGMQAAWLVRPDGHEVVPESLDERIQVVPTLGDVAALLC